MRDSDQHLRVQLLQAPVRHVTGLVRRLEQWVAEQRRLLAGLAQNPPKDR